MKKLRSSGGYRDTCSFQTATIIYDATVWFCENQSDPPNPSDQNIPPCPNCQGQMTLRTAKTGKNAGKSFWGCANYPDCKGIIPL
jgi:restriction system protein